ncbi:MAG: hypothetical protein C0463_07035 [Idiomarina sp.]|nr:hypothetical protein [Idiomarina sp.]
MGEGPAEKAFVNHLKGMYSRDTGQKVTVEAGDGGSPSTMVKNLIRKHSHADFDRRFLMIDEDIPVPESVHARAKQAKIEIILSTPVCLEGMLLEVLSQRVAEGSSASDCKALLHPQLSGSPTRSQSYRELFPEPVINQSRKHQIIKLRALLRNEL